MKNKLNIIANLVLLAALDVTLFYTGKMSIESDFNYIAVTVFFAALAMGLFLVRDTYKMIKPDLRAAFIGSTPVSDEYDYEDEDYYDEEEEY